MAGEFDDALRYDIRLHGARFIAVEFVFVATFFSALATLVLAALVLVGGASALGRVAGAVVVLLFAGWAVNCWLVAAMAGAQVAAAAGQRLEVELVRRYTVLLAAVLLVPGGVVYLRLRRWASISSRARARTPGRGRPGPRR